MQSLSNAQRQKLLELTARSGVLANLEVAIAVAGCQVLRAVLNAAASAGHLHVVEWAIAKGCPCGGDTVNAAAKSGHVELTLELLQRAPNPRSKFSWWDEAIRAAAGAGQRGLCEALVAAGESLPYSMVHSLYDALTFGHGDTATWLLQRMQQQRRPDGGPGPWPRPNEAELLQWAARGLALPPFQALCAARTAATGVSLPRYTGLLAYALASPTPDWRAKVEWLVAAGCVFSTAVRNYQDCCEPDLVDRADSGERLALLRGWDALRPEPMLFFACMNCNLSALRYLVGEGLVDVVHGDPALLNIAVGWPEDGDGDGDAAVAFLREMLQLGWPMEASVVVFAAPNPQLLRWMAGPEAGPEVGAALVAALSEPELAAGVAKGGNLEMMRWLRGLGGVWDEAAFAAAAKAGNPKLLEWMAAEGCPMGATGAPYVAAGANSDMLTLACLRRLGCPWDPTGATFSDAVWPRSGVPCSLAALLWLVKQGCPVDWVVAGERAVGRLDEGAKQVREWIAAQQHHVQQEQ